MDMMEYLLHDNSFTNNNLEVFRFLCQSVHPFIHTEEKLEIRMAGEVDAKFNWSRSMAVS